MNIAIVTSMYNHYDRFLPQWAYSISKLKTKPTQVVIVISGPDYDKSNIEDSLDILTKCDVQFKVIYLSSHISMGVARNEAAKNADTEWIVYLDVDDLILPSAIDTFSKYSDRADVISGGLKIIGAKEEKELKFINASKDAALRGEHVCCSHAAYKKKFWEVSPYITINDFIEQPLWLGFAQHGANFIGTPEICTIYNTRTDGHNMSMTDEERRQARVQKDFFIKNGVKDEVVKEVLYYNYCKMERHNFGDELTPIVLSWISNRQLEYVSYSENKKLLSIGSIMTRWKENDVIWGTGTMYDKELIAPKGVKVLAVRGPLSRALISGTEVPEVYGDPALLMPLIYTPNPTRKYSIGVIPHYVDKHRFSILTQDRDILIIDICDDPYKIIDQINSCDVVISTSLHGIIVSEAYGVPAVWLKVSDEVLGGNHKFHDYLLSTGREVQDPVFAMNGVVTSKAIRLIAKAPLSKPVIDTKPLINAFKEYFK